MADIVRTRFADSRPTVLTVCENRNAEMRTAGFSDSCGTWDVDILRMPSDYFADVNMHSSRIARLLSGISDDRAVLYVTFGLSGFVRAIEKLRLGDRLVCLCHDTARNEQADFIVAVCRQDTYRQGYDAIRLAADFLFTALYPMQKCTYTPSCMEYLHVQ